MKMIIEIDNDFSTDLKQQYFIQRLFFIGCKCAAKNVFHRDRLNVEEKDVNRVATKKNFHKAFIQDSVGHGIKKKHKEQ